MIGRALTGCVRAYQWTRSGTGGQRCRYYPTCSHYAADAIREFGAFRGAVLAVWRLVRCNPWTPGGVDHARDQRVFR